MRDKTEPHRQRKAKKKEVKTLTRDEFFNVLKRVIRPFQPQEQPGQEKKETSE